MYRIQNANSRQNSAITAKSSGWVNCILWYKFCMSYECDEWRMSQVVREKIPIPTKWLQRHAPCWSLFMFTLAHSIPYKLPSLCLYQQQNATFSTKTELQLVRLEHCYPHTHIFRLQIICLRVNKVEMQFICAPCNDNLFVSTYFHSYTYRYNRKIHIFTYSVHTSTNMFPFIQCANVHRMHENAASSL